METDGRTPINTLIDMIQQTYPNAVVETVHGPDFLQYVVSRTGEPVERPYLYVAQTGDDPVKLSVYADGRHLLDLTDPTSDALAHMAVHLMALFPQAPFDAVSIADDGHDERIASAKEAVGMLQSLGFVASTHAPIGEF